MKILRVVVFGLVSAIAVGALVMVIVLAIQVNTLKRDLQVAQNHARRIAQLEIGAIKIGQLEAGLALLKGQLRRKILRRSQLPSPHSRVLTKTSRDTTKTSIARY